MSSDAPTEKSSLLPRTEKETASAAASGTNLSQTTYNMVNCLVGAGILTVPYAFKLGGYGAVGCLAFVATVNFYMARLLGWSIEKVNPPKEANWDMAYLAGEAYGAPGRTAVGVTFALELWFCLETFLVLIGINGELMFGVSRTASIVAAGALGVFLVLAPMRALADVSLLSVLCLGGALVLLVAAGAMSPELTHPPAPALGMDLTTAAGLISATGMFFYCFAGLPCFPNIHQAMTRPSEYGKACGAAFGFSAVYYLLIGGLGYWFYGAATHQSFTENLGRDPTGKMYASLTLIPLVAAGIFVIKLQCGYPLYVQPIVKVFESQLFGDVPPFQTQCINRVIFTVISVAFAVFAQRSLDAVASLTGCALTTMTSFVLPTVIYYRLCGEDLGRAERVLLPLVAAAGVVFAVVGTVNSASRLYHQAPSAVARFGWQGEI